MNTRRRTWLVALPINAVLGVLALGPLVSTLVAAHAVAHHFRWADPSLVDQDEHGAIALVVVVNWLVAAPVIVGVNLVLRRRVGRPGVPLRAANRALLALPYALSCWHNGSLIW